MSITKLNCPLCQGKDKPTLRVGKATCNLCGNTSQQPIEGYTYIIIDTKTNKKIGYRTIKE